MFDHRHRRRWDPDWRTWITKRYGSLAAAEKDWGVPAPRDARGRVTAPSDRQLRDDGPWRVMTAAYRRFMDDLASRKWGRVERVLRRLDPHHLISFRQGNTLPQDFAFTGTVKHIDFICPEGYAVPDSETGFHVAGAITRFVDFTTRGKPIVWAEFGTSVWNRRAMRPDPADFQRQKHYHELFYRAALAAGANGTAPWWWPGGYRVNERSDFGIIDPDGRPRPAALCLQHYSLLLRRAPPRPPADARILYDRDAHAGGYWYFLFHAAANAWAAAHQAGKHLGFYTAGTGTNSMNTPLLAVGNRPCTGHNPPKFLDAEFNRLEIRDRSGRWREASDGARIRVRAGAPVRARISLGNIQEAAWIAPARAGGRPGGVYLASTPRSQVSVRIPLPADTPYLGDADFGEVQLLPAARGIRTVELRLEAAGRTPFGEVRTFTLMAVP